MSEILLTIGIPTFNGSKYLRETINGTLLQILNLGTKNVEIIISDNASTDNTPEIVKSFLDNYPDIVKYFANETNVGFDKNVDLLFKRAKGKYVEILGDDDFLCAGALYNIMRVLQRTKEYSVILLNMGFLDINSGNEYGEYKIENDLSFHNGDDFFQYSKWRTSAVSSIIIKREDWNSIDLLPHFGTQWIHISAIIEILAQGKSSYVISEKSIIVRTGNSRWGSHFGNQLKVGLQHLEVFSMMLNLGYARDTYQYFLKYRYRTNLNDIIYLAPFNFAERIRILRLMMHLFGNFFLFWIIHIPVLLIVSYPFQMLKSSVKYIYYKAFFKSSSLKHTT